MKRRIMRNAEEARHVELEPSTPMDEIKISVQNFNQAKRAMTDTSTIWRTIVRTM